MLRLRTEALSESHMRGEMRDLAREFPGALRELDTLPLDAINRRLEQVTTCELAPPWMIATLHYHRVLGGLLAAKAKAPKLPRGGSLVNAAIESVAQTMGLSAGETDALIFAELRRRRTA